MGLFVGKLRMLFVETPISPPARGLQRPCSGGLTSSTTLFCSGNLALELDVRASLLHTSPMDYSDIITIRQGVRSGKPCIRGMRITVQDVLEYLASGMSEQDILDDFPELTSEDIRACLAFAADRERRLMVA